MTSVKASGGGLSSTNWNSCSNAARNRNPASRSRRRARRARNVRGQPSHGLPVGARPRRTRKNSSGETRPPRTRPDAGRGIGDQPQVAERSVGVGSASGPNGVNESRPAPSRSRWRAGREHRSVAISRPRTKPPGSQIRNAVSGRPSRRVADPIRRAVVPYVELETGGEQDAARLRGRRAGRRR